MRNNTQKWVQLSKVRPVGGERFILSEKWRFSAQNVFEWARFASIKQSLLFNIQEKPSERIVEKNIPIGLSCTCFRMRPSRDPLRHLPEHLKTKLCALEICLSTSGIWFQIGGSVAGPAYKKAPQLGRGGTAAEKSASSIDFTPSIPSWSSEASLLEEAKYAPKEGSYRKSIRGRGWAGGGGDRAALRWLGRWRMLAIAQIGKCDDPFYNIQKMEQSAKNTTKKYAKISMEKRVELVRSVVENGTIISEAARRLGVKLSIAKLILKRFKEEGTFFQSRKDRKERVSAQRALSFQQFLPFENVDISLPFGTVANADNPSTYWACPLGSEQPLPFFPCTPLPELLQGGALSNFNSFNSTINGMMLYWI